LATAKACPWRSSPWGAAPLVRTAKKAHGKITETWTGFLRPDIPKEMKDKKAMNAMKSMNAMKGVKAKK
jgi:hypothetical protein